MPSSSSASLKREQVKLSTSPREQPTADLRDDTDMQYPSVRDDDDVCNEALDGHIDLGMMRADDIHLNRHPSNGQLHSKPIFKAECCRDEVNQTNTDLRSNEIPKVEFDDKMEPDDMEMEFGNNSAREMWIGRVFPDRQMFRNTLAKFAIYGNFTLKHLKTNMTKVTARCKDQDCPWRIHASIVESGPQFKVRTYNPNHRCSKPLMGMAHQQATSALIREFIMERVRQNVNLKPKEIMNDYQMEFGSIISYRKAYIAKEMALCIVRGSYEESFQLLPRYCKELELTNPGTVTNIDTTSDDRFRRFFWAFGPCIRSYTSSLRPVIAVDGSHLRGKYPGVLLVAVTHDANHKLLPIAFAFAEAERRDSWEWFLANLSISLGEPTNLTIVSDRQKGLIPALKNTIPHAMHCYCCRHIAENIKAAFSDGAIVMKFWRAATSYRPCEYEAYMTDIRAVSQEAFNYIDAIGRQRWANAYIEGRRYDMLTSNAAECTNSLLKDTRVLPITKQVEEIRGKLMDFYQKRHLQSESITTRLTPYAEKVLSQEMDEARRLHVRVAGIVEFQVQSAEYVDVVDLERKSCTCRKWEILGIPCCHAIAAMKMRNYDPYEFCEHWYFASTYRTTYSEVIHATRDSKQWEHTAELRVIPPMSSKQPGRPKKNRIRTEDIGRVRRAVTCSNCKGRGHNRGSCRNPPVLS